MTGKGPLAPRPMLSMAALSAHPPGVMQLPPFQALATQLRTGRLPASRGRDGDRKEGGESGRQAAANQVSGLEATVVRER